MYQKTYYISALLLLFACAAVARLPNWTNLQPRGGPTPLRDQPGAVLVKNNLILSVLGYTDNCNQTENDYQPANLIYAYNPRTNEGKNVTATGDFPAVRSYFPAWKSGEGLLQITGGADYSWDFSTFLFYPYDTIYELNARDPDNYFWTAYPAQGDIPSARAEASFVQDPRDPHHVYFFGGIGFDASFNLISHGDVYRLNTVTHTFTRLSNTSALDDETDNHPMSRYHAIPFLWHTGPRSSDVEFQIHQGVHREGPSHPNPGDALELDDTNDWAFNVGAGTWRRISPNPHYPVAVRHGMQIQFETRDNYGGSYDLLCLQSGDGIHADQGSNAKTTFQCEFDIDPVSPELWCKDPRANPDLSGHNPQGAWFQVPTTGMSLDDPQINSKYITASCPYSKADNAVYCIGGSYVLPKDNATNWQVFHDSVRRLRLGDLADAGDDF